MVFFQQMFIQNLPFFSIFQLATLLTKVLFEQRNIFSLTPLLGGGFNPFCQMKNPFPK